MLQGVLRGTGIVAAACALLGLAAAAPASASERAGLNYYVSFKADRFHTGGFDVLVNAERFGKVDRSVALSVRRGDRDKGHGDRISTFYTPTSRARVSAARVRSRLGERGSIGMRFHSRTRRVKRFGCDRKIVNRGVLVGHLRFRGEAGYLRVLEHRLPARRVRYRFKKCPGSASAARPQEKPVILAACRRQSLFGARQMPSGRNDFVALGAFGVNRGLYTGTIAILSGTEGKDQFTYAPDLSAAQVDPPRPFRGTGQFSEVDGEGRFEGSLRASFFATKRIRFAPATGKLVRRRSASCDFGFSDREEARAAEARDAALRLLGAGWVAGAPGF